MSHMSHVPFVPTISNVPIATVSPLTLPTTKKRHVLNVPCLKRPNHLNLSDHHRLILSRSPVILSRSPVILSPALSF